MDIAIDLNKTCDFGYDPERDNARRKSGIGYLFDQGELVASAHKAGTSIDALLTARMAEHLYKKRPKTAFLIYAVKRAVPMGECLDLMITNKGMKNDGDWLLAAIPGFIDRGRDWIGDEAQPYVYWDGKLLCRLYPAEWKDHAYVWSSARPETGEQPVKIGGKVHKVYHAFYQIIE